jgi:putative membrane protein insertion efficiency factor
MPEDTVERICIINDPLTNRLTAPQDRLYRPRISLLVAGCFLLGLLIIALVLSSVLVWATQESSVVLDKGGSFILRTLMVSGIVLPVLLVLCRKVILVWLVRVYQRYAKAEIRLRCCFEPSCSEYTILAIKKYGVLYGGIKCIKRFRRCKYPGGVDYP